MIRSPFDKRSSNNIKSSSDLISTDDENRILCIYCKRTRSNGIGCKGICVEENEY